jgi:hypothetical protein
MYSSARRTDTRRWRATEQRALAGDSDRLEATDRLLHGGGTGNDVGREGLAEAAHSGCRDAIHGSAARGEPGAGIRRRARGGFRDGSQSSLLSRVGAIPCSAGSAGGSGLASPVAAHRRRAVSGGAARAAGRRRAALRGRPIRLRGQHLYTLLDSGAPRGARRDATGPAAWRPLRVHRARPQPATSHASLAGAIQPRVAPHRRWLQPESPDRRIGSRGWLRDYAARLLRVRWAPCARADVPGRRATRALDSPPPDG